MDNMNGVGGHFYMGEYGVGGVGSMMSLMTEQDEPAATGESMMSTITIPQSCCSSFSYGHGHVEGLLSTIFHGGEGDQISLAGHHHHNEKHLVGGHFRPQQLILNEQAAVISDSSLSSVKMEATSHHMEFHKKEGAGGEGEELRPSYCPQPCVILRECRSRKEQEGSRMVTSIDVESACSSNPNDSMDAMKARIAGHPHYPRLQAAYMDCQKIGAPPDVVEALKEIIKDSQHGRRSPTMSIGADPELDQFMEAYCEILGKLQVELNKPFKEAMAFVNKVEAELNCIGVAALKNCPPGASDEREDEGGSSEGEFSCGDADLHEFDPHAQDKELKDMLLRKYSGYFSTLKQEFLKKKKKGKLPKEARLKLLEWWNLHYKWPYPSETDKVALAESTGLDQKQINNWFINQRKRHWKPSEDMKYVIMDSLNPHGNSFFIDPKEG